VLFRKEDEMLILEGSDCLGKTTFANLLVKMAAEDARYPIYYAHMTRPNKAFNFCSHYKERITKFAVQDRFHIGGIVWHNAISNDALEIIERDLFQTLSQVIVFYTTDRKWFLEKLQSDKRGNLLSIETMLNANNNYYRIAKGGHPLNVKVDFSFNIKSSDGEPTYPGEKEAREILDSWYKNLEILETLTC
jgi:hypothetical protein